MSGAQVSPDPVPPARILVVPVGDGAQEDVAVEVVRGWGLKNVGTVHTVPVHTVVSTLRDASPTVVLLLIAPQTTAWDKEIENLMQVAASGTDREVVVVLPDDLFTEERVEKMLQAGVADVMLGGPLVWECGRRRRQQHRQRSGPPCPDSTTCRVRLTNVVASLLARLREAKLETALETARLSLLRCHLTSSGMDVVNLEVDASRRKSNAKQPVRIGDVTHHGKGMTSDEEKKMKEKEALLNRLKSEVSSALESPLQVVIRIVGDLLRRDFTVMEAKEALVMVLRSVASMEVHQPSVSKILEEVPLDKTTKLWLISEYFTNGAGRIGPPKEPSSPFNWPDAGKHKPLTGTDELKRLSFDTMSHDLDDLLPIALEMFHSIGVIDKFGIPLDKMQSLLRTVAQMYQANPYHNFQHAIDVMQFVYYLLTTCRAAEYLTFVDIFALLLAAFCHDADHPGLNNSFQVNAGSQLALLYNDSSVLENHHAYQAFRVLRDPRNNVLEVLSASERHDFRQTFVACILATDMALHFEITNKFKTLLSTQTVSVFRESPKERTLLLKVILHCADLSNQVRPLESMHKWTSALLDEFFSQGDLEKELGLPVSPLNDRDKADVCEMELNFIDFIVTPIFSALQQVVPDLQEGLDNLQTNRQFWLESSLSTHESDEGTPRGRSGQDSGDPVSL